MSKELINTILPYILVGGLGLFAISRLTPNIKTPEELITTVKEGSKGIIEGTIEGIGDGVETVIDKFDPVPQEERQMVELGGLCSDNSQCIGSYGPFSQIGCCNGICTNKNLVGGIPVCPNSQWTEQQREHEQARQESLQCGGKICQDDETCNNGVCIPKVSKTIQLCGQLECPDGWNCTTSSDPSLPLELRNTPICVDTSTSSLGQVCGSNRCPPGWKCENRKCKII
jgi:hypothetical protein